jgi:hypothetical protein
MAAHPAWNTKKVTPPAVKKDNNGYIWASITENCINKGNYIIEQCLKNLLKLPEPNLVIDVFNCEFPEDLNDYCFVVNPGCTNLDPRDTLAFRKLKKPKIPIVCFGGSIWCNDSRRNLSDVDLIEVARKMWSPVGCRDPFTYDLLRRNGIDAKFIGGPTLFSQIPSTPGDYIAFSFARDNVPKQIKLLSYLAKHNDVKVIIHEAQEEAYCRKLKVSTVVDSSLFLDFYYNARCVVTGRLHGAMPGIAADLPVFFFQSKKGVDSRLTLLEYLDLPLLSLEDIYSSDLSSIDYDTEKVAQLKQSFLSYVEAFKKEFGI